MIKFSHIQTNNFASIIDWWATPAAFAAGQMTYIKISVEAIRTCSAEIMWPPSPAQASSAVFASELAFLSNPDHTKFPGDPFIICKKRCIIS